MYRYLIFILCGLIVLLLGATMVSVLQERAARNTVIANITPEIKGGQSTFSDENGTPTPSIPTPEPKPITPTATITETPPSVGETRTGGLTIYLPIVNNSMTP